jgi:hypothetical protein
MFMIWTPCGNQNPNGPGMCPVCVEIRREQGRYQLKKMREMGQVFWREMSDDEAHKLRRRWHRLKEKVDAGRFPIEGGRSIVMCWNNEELFGEALTDDGFDELAKRITDTPRGRQWRWPKALVEQMREGSKDVEKKGRTIRFRAEMSVGTMTDYLERMTAKYIPPWEKSARFQTFEFPEGTTLEDAVAVVEDIRVASNKQITRLYSDAEKDELDDAELETYR